MKNVVLIGGGTGLSAMMQGLKELDDINLTAIISVADDGGSTGRLRDNYDMPAMGDIRHVLCAMAADRDDSIFPDLMNYRFSGDEDVGGHQLGNLIFTALTDITGSFMGAVQAIGKVLKVRGEILPVSLDNAILYALMADGTLVRGEKNIPSLNNSIEKVFYQQKVQPYSKAVKAIEEADLIIYGIGSLYTSIIPNLIVDGISQAIYNNLCPKVYFCNAMSQPGETDGFSMEDHVSALEKHLYKNAVDCCILNSRPIPEETLQLYEKSTGYPINALSETHTYQIWKRPLILIDEKGKIRHDPMAVADVVEELVKQLSDSVKPVIKTDLQASEISQ